MKFTYPWRPKRMPNLQEKSAALQKEHPELQNMKILYFFYFCGSFLRLCLTSAIQNAPSPHGGSKVPPCPCPSFLSSAPQMPCPDAAEAQCRIIYTFRWCRGLCNVDTFRCNSGPCGFDMSICSSGLCGVGTSRSSTCSCCPYKCRCCSSPYVVDMSRCSTGHCIEKKWTKALKIAIFQHKAKQTSLFLTF